MLLVMDKFIHEGHLCQPIQTDCKIFKIAGSYLTGYSGILNATNKNTELIFTSVFEGAEYNVITILLVAYER